MQEESVPLRNCKFTLTLIIKYQIRLYLVCLTNYFNKLKEENNQFQWY
ncbi:Uncharacterised protein [Serratia proteamaculans]|nr:Uncharacterised protein [Serratia proteamaculans]